jgi:hypothetical protein
MSGKLLQIGLYACVAYFCAMSAAHFAGFKVPLLFIYWDVPSNHYQDMIISFCAFTYAVLFFTAARHRAAVPGALVALAGTVVGLSAVNASSHLAAMIPGAPTTAYWAQTGMIAGLLVTLVVLYRASRSA